MFYNCRIGFCGVFFVMNIVYGVGVFNVRNYGKEYDSIYCCSSYVIINVIEFRYIEMIINKDIVYWDVY